LVDERATTLAIKERLGWLINGLKNGDRVLFHYSGHGAQVPTRSLSGEVDGLDEVICPVDFDWSEDHLIRDKEFHKLFSLIPGGVEFIWVSDSCHSGDLWRDFPAPDRKIKTLIPPADINWRLQTILDGTKNIKPLTMAKAAENINLALISGCESKQTSADAFFNGRSNGALTYFLLKELRAPNGMAIPLKAVVLKTTAALDSAGYDQKPQLEGSGAIKDRSFLHSN
jgi:metacaspase-1